MPLRIGIIGTGAMGLGVVQSLVRNGIAVGARDILPRAEEGQRAGLFPRIEVDVLPNL